MRIPLDYYRILGIPIQVTDEQLRQAYQDRSLQLPRREYSQGAITARKQLLDEAYEILSDPDKKKEYNAQFLEKTYTIDSESQLDPHSPQTGETQESFLDNHTPWLDIRPEQLIGGLLILQELGEYELVIRQGKACLRTPHEYQSSLSFREDIVLTVALAYLELSREQWQQREYEIAADSGNKGLELLRKEELFFNLQQEIEIDLFKLRPYCILELLALPLTSTQKRKKGLQLLQQMLEQRHGIDGKGEDYSGLNLDDFLRFIQQLRIHLTVEEQHHLFEGEAQRPSAVASYLRVYTQIAQGFAHKEPIYILAALTTLQQLGKRQDVFLEQAICYLLLGQTEKAIFALEQSHERETLEFIKEHSQGAPDLLPGLCLYGERWLQTEVFSHFRDLMKEQASLKKYFADEEVQNYLEELSFENQSDTQPVETDFELSSESSSPVLAQYAQVGWTRETTPSVRESFSHRSQTATEVYGSPQPTTASLFQRQSSSSSKINQKRGYGETFREYTQGNVALNADYEETPSSRSSYRRRRSKSLTPVEPVIEPVIEPQEQLSVIPPSAPRKPVKSKRKTVNKRPLMLAILVLFSLGMGALLLKLLPNSRVSLAGLEGEYLAIGLHHSPLDIPPADAHVIIAGPLTEQNAKLVLQEWLYSKSIAFGKKHQIERLQQVLADPMLSLWENRARSMQKSRSYYQYDHQVDLRSVNLNEQNPDQAVVEAQVKETAKFYQNGKLNQARSYDDNLLIRYELIRQENKWKIQESKIVNNG
ncbi:heat shock protein DnaJ domain protein [Gloeothece citriformis PCC 7424]|uniref:Heat shock protein DnaJ domain protein n=1 Tax=Gloeothece citriformis (strain PCC 7424) TaxID=65393 RepID=B7KEM0_GLOC7|nr:IMS domain-containing protein [Gloeothece citriformis]ACK69045.1 heat shock protein DnaJ domain protein [Gloeothece citriformis PCC 7424]